MERIKFTFKRGGSLVAVFDEKRAPETVKSLLEALPCEGDVMHTRWCGREIFVPTPTIHKPPKENQTNCVAKGDIAYWRDFDNPEAPTIPLPKPYPSIMVPNSHAITMAFFIATFAVISNTISSISWKKSAKTFGNMVSTGPKWKDCKNCFALCSPLGM